MAVAGMAVPVPFSPAFVLLLPALPLVWLVGRALARAVRVRPGLGRAAAV